MNSYTLPVSRFQHDKYVCTFDALQFLGESKKKKKKGRAFGKLNDMMQTTLA